MNALKILERVVVDHKVCVYAEMSRDPLIIWRKFVRATMFDRAEEKKIVQRDGVRAGLPTVHSIEIVAIKIA